MENQPCYDKNGKPIGWLSRSVAVLMVTLGKDKDGKTYVLASQRGEGTPDPEFVGAWNCCCGYLDYNETTEEAAIRETFEETGIIVPKSCVFDMGWIDDPKSDKRQNLSHRFMALLPKSINNYKFSHKNNETDEVGEIKWISIEELDDYKWAFNHDKIIKEIISL